MRKITVDKLKITVADASEKLPDIASLPEGCALMLSGGSAADRERAAKRLSRKYRVKERDEEDVKARVGLFDGTFESAIQSDEYIICGADVLEAIVALNAFVRKPANALILADIEKRDAASDYCTVAAKLTDLTDYRIFCMVSGAEYEAKQIRALRREITAAIKNCTGVSAADTALKAAAVEGFVKFESAEVKMNRALRMLLRNENRAELPYGFTGVLCAAAINGVYKQFLLRKFGFVMPPDNNLRLEQASEYLGVDENGFAPARFGDWSERRIEEAKYVLECNRAELLAEVCFNQLALRAATEKIKKTLPYGGYRQFNAVSAGDLRIALALAVDFGWLPNGGLYSLMKSMGALDALLQ